MRFLIALGLLGGCAAPRTITGMTMSGDQMKLVYNGASNGLIECSVAEDGALTTCQRLPVTFKKKGQ